MEVSVNHLVSNVVLAEDVIGKSSHPLIPRQTVLTDKHIHFLKMFLVEKVKIEPRLSDGSIFRI